MIPIAIALGKAGLGFLAKAVAKKGIEHLKEKTGIDLGSITLDANGNIPAEDILRLKSLEMQHKETLLRIEADVTISSSREATKRNTDDMAGTEWLPKNIRPLVLATLTLATVIAIFAPSVTAEKFMALTGLDTMVYGYYFIGRSGEKGMFKGIAQAFKKKVN